MGFLSGLGKVLGVAGPIASMIPGVGTAVGVGLGALGGALQGAGKEAQANKLNSQALQMAMQRYKDMAPFRQQAMTIGQNLQPQRPDLSSAFASGNPFARRQPNLSGMALPGFGGPTGGPTGGPPAPTPPGGGMAGGMGRGAPGMPSGVPGGMGGGLGGGMNQQLLQHAMQRRGEMMT